MHEAHVSLHTSRYTQRHICHVNMYIMPALSSVFIPYLYQLERIFHPFPPGWHMVSYVCSHSLQLLYTGHAIWSRLGWHFWKSCQGGISQGSAGDALLMGTVWSPWDRDDCHKGWKVRSTLSLSLSPPPTHTQISIAVFCLAALWIFLSSLMLCSALVACQENVSHVPGWHLRHGPWVRVCSADGFHPCGWQEIQVSAPHWFYFQGEFKLNSLDSYSSTTCRCHRTIL